MNHVRSDATALDRPGLLGLGLSLTPAVSSRAQRPAPRRPMPAEKKAGPPARRLSGDHHAHAAGPLPRGQVRPAMIAHRRVAGDLEREDSRWASTGIPCEKPSSR